MIIKKSNILFSRSCSIHSFAASSFALQCNTSSIVSSTLRTQPSSSKRQRLPYAEKRDYATVANDGADDLSHLRWPDTPRGQRHPSPYQILASSQTEPYNKQRFYELVKLYHPDRSGSTASPLPLPGSHPCYNIPHNTKLERYRLIVAAHGILSDPGKRRAYDTFGTGWSGNVGSTSSHRHGRGGHASRTRPGPFSGWQEHPEPDIWANATWEDWEKFYARRDPGHPAHQVPNYFRNSHFVTIVLILAMVGSTANYERAEINGEKFLEARDAMHDRAARELRKVRQQSEARPKEERIQFFVRQREATMLGVSVEEVRQDKLDKLLPPQEPCMSEDLRAKDWESGKSEP